MNIIIDAMGGDFAPGVPVRGALLARDNYGCDLTFVGREEEIRSVLAQEGIRELPNGVRIVNTTEVVEMHDDPARACLKKKDSSMSVGLRMVRDGEGDAFVSAGSTGALLSGATLIVKRIKGIRRSCVAPLIPTGRGRALLIDAGANAECTPEFLLQFAYMGSFYMQKMKGIQNPRVGLVNIGAEPEKGSELYKETHALLQDAHDAGRINFIGNMEPTMIASDEAPDVIVADGFTGNIILKTMEGTASFIVHALKDIFTTNVKTKMGYLMVKNAMGPFKKSIDSREVGGSAMMGIQKPVVKAHGNSDEYAFQHAIRQAVEFVRADVNGEIERNIQHMTVSPKNPVEKLLETIPTAKKD